MQKTYCSKECLQLDNRCNICKKGSERYLCFTSPGGRNMMICETCANQPKCYSCCIPYPSRQLPDGRFLCIECEKTVITDFNEIMKIFRKVRRDMSRYYGYDANHKIDLKLVTPDELAKATPSIPKSPNSRQLAAMLYRYEMREITTYNGQKSYQMGATHCSALFLTYVPRELLIDSIAHELTHDYLRHKAGMIPVLKIEEGFCEAVAADYNIKRNQAALNIRKANNPDPIYGDGYREMSKMLKQDGFPKTAKYLRSIAKPMLDQMRNR